MQTTDNKGGVLPRGRQRVVVGAVLAALVVAGVLHVTAGAVTGSIASIPALVLVAPLISQGTDALRGRLRDRVVGLIQPAFGNAAELAITLVALAHGLPDVARIAIAGSILSNGILVAGLAGFAPVVARRSLRGGGLVFRRELFAGLATLSVVAVLPVALLSFWEGRKLTTSSVEDLSLAAGVVLVVLAVMYLINEAFGAERPGRERPEAAPRSGRRAALLLGVGAVVAALASEWFVDGFEPAADRLGMPQAFAALVIIPLVGNVGESYAAIRLAAAGDGDAAMGVLMNSVVQVATLMTGLLVIASQFLSDTPLTLRFDPLVALGLLLSLIVLWMIVHDGGIQPDEAAGLLAVYAIIAAAVWVEGA